MSLFEGLKDNIIEEVFNKSRIPTKRDTIKKIYKGSSGLPGGG